MHDSVTSWGFSLPIHDNCAYWLFHTHEMILHQKSAVCQGMSLPFQFRKSNDDLEQVEKSGVFTTLNELVHNLMSAFLLEI